MNIYTRTGDLGQTSLFSGERVSKTDKRIHALGDIDELTSHLGKVKSITDDYRVKKDIERIQNNLIKLMGIVASLENRTFDFSLDEVAWVESKIDLYSQEYVQPKKFILPGENTVSAQMDIARTVARRAERALYECEVIPIELKKYINRLSDYLYTVARMIETIPKKETKVIDNIRSNTMLLEEAKKIIHLVEEYAKYQQCNVSIAITNKDGNPICVHSMDNSLMISFEVAVKKAYTAAALQMPTHELAKLTAQGAAFFGLENILDKQIVTIGGGIPLKSNGKTVGAIGVSGGSAEEDIDLAMYAQYVWEGAE